MVSDQGYLLGVVVEVEATSCKVMNVLHPNFNAAGVISRTRDNGILNGNTDLRRGRPVHPDQSGARTET